MKKLRKKENKKIPRFEKFLNFSQCGFGLIEIVVGVALISMFLFGIAEVGKLGSRLVDGAGTRLQAVFLVAEGIDAVRGIRDAGWNTGISPLSDDADYRLVFDGTRWTLSVAPEPLINGLFSRSVRFFQVERGGNDDIVTSGGTVDPDTRKVTVSVSWSERGATSTTSVSTYTTNLFNN